MGFKEGAGSLGTTILRVSLGVVFVAHGFQKLQTWGWGGGAPFFAEAGIPFATLAAPLVTGAELGGGLLLLVGLATRPVAAMLAFVMFVAAITVHLPYGFFAPNGVELVFVIGMGLVTLVLQGGGVASLDALLQERRRSAPS